MPTALSSIQKLVLDAIADAADVPPEEVDHQAKIGDLGLDSLDFWAILMQVEDEAGSDVPADVFDRLALFDTVPTVAELLAATDGWE